MNDAHCHFFSETFLASLAGQRGRSERANDLARELGWEPPADAADLSDRWVRELDTFGVDRAALIASVPGDEGAVAGAVARHPLRFVGFFMLDPSAPDAPERARAAIVDQGLRTICLFPAMHHVALGDARVERIVAVAAAQPG